VGDFVRVELTETPGSVEERLERRTLLFRASAGEGRRAQVLVANADQVLVVASIRAPALSFSGVDRILAAAEHGDLGGVVCLNKIDLAAKKEAEEAAGIYRRAGFPTLLTCGLRGDGLEDLRAALEGKITVLAGASGVGKSTLINALQPGLDLRIAPVTGKMGEGRHTTTGIRLLRLDFGGQVVDTPGIRSFALWQVEAEDVRLLFRDLRGIERRCRFSSCLHREEPGCAVRAAVKRRRIAPSRYASYLDVLAECQRERRATAVDPRRERRTRIPRQPRAPIEEEEGAEEDAE
jgi:ribosome biogenesis GTPase